MDFRTIERDPTALPRSLSTATSRWTPDFPAGAGSRSSDAAGFVQLATAACPIARASPTTPRLLTDGTIAPQCASSLTIDPAPVLITRQAVGWIAKMPGEPGLDAHAEPELAFLKYWRAFECAPIARLSRRSWRRECTRMSFARSSDCRVRRHMGAAFDIGIHDPGDLPMSPRTAIPIPFNAQDDPICESESTIFMIIPVHAQLFIPRSFIEVGLRRLISSRCGDHLRIHFTGARRGDQIVISETAVRRWGFRDSCNESPSSPGGYPCHHRRCLPNPISANSPE